MVMTDAVFLEYPGGMNSPEPYRGFAHPGARTCAQVCIHEPLHRALVAAVVYILVTTCEGIT